jgi:hypothetical protein
MSYHHCPRCDSTLKQIHRRFFDRLISQFYQVHRYRCSNPECRWTGLLHNKRYKAKKWQPKLWVWVLIVLVGVAIGLVLVERLSTPPSTSTDVATTP